MEELSPAERMQWLQLDAIPAAARQVRDAHQAWLTAKEFKDGLCDELRELSQLMLDLDTGPCAYPDEAAPSAALTAAAAGPPSRALPRTEGN